MKISTDDKLTIDKLLEEKTAASRAIEARETLGKLIDKNVMSQPRGAKRWRAAVDLWIALGDMYVTPGFTAEQEYKAVVSDNRKKRQALKNQWGKSEDKNSDLRQALNMPHGADMFIKLVDPEVMTVENTVKLAKEFPEFLIPERI